MRTDKKSGNRFHSDFSGELLRALLLVAVTVCMLRAGLPDPALEECVQVGDTINCTGNESGGVSITGTSYVPVVNTLNVHSLSGPILPASTVPGIRFQNGSGYNAYVYSGTTQDTVSIGATNSYGILATTQGTPPTPPDDPYVSRMYFNIALAAGSASFFCERIWSRSVTCLRSFSPFLVVIER